MVNAVELVSLPSGTPRPAGQDATAPAEIKAGTVITMVTQRSTATADRPKSGGSMTAASESSGHAARVPIFMYHYIRVNPDPADRLGFNLSVTPANFTAQMNYLADRGYRSISLEELARFLSGRVEELPSRAVVLTFDDGYRDAYEEAYPVLRKLGLRATIFMITGLVGRPGYLTWDQLRELSANGVSVGAHTVNHPDLARVSSAAAGREIEESKTVLERELGAPATLFSYPSGSYDDNVVELVRKAGFEAAVTVKYGLSHRPQDRLTLARVRVSGGQTIAGFAASAGLP